MRLTEAQRRATRRTWAESGAVVHAEGADGNDYTLCGTALEEGGDGRPLTASDRKISCAACTRIIRAAKAIRARDISPYVFEPSNALREDVK